MVTSFHTPPKASHTDLYTAASFHLVWFPQREGGAKFLHYCCAYLPLCLSPDWLHTLTSSRAPPCAASCSSCVCLASCLATEAPSPYHQLGPGWVFITAEHTHRTWSHWIAFADSRLLIMGGLCISNLINVDRSAIHLCYYVLPLDCHQAIKLYTVLECPYLASRCDWLAELVSWHS